MLNVPQILTLPCHYAEHGKLSVYQENFPIVPNRLFWITGTKFGRSRGDHAHREANQVFIPLHGEFEAQVDGPHGFTRTFDLVSYKKETLALFLPKLHWITLVPKLDDSIVLVVTDRDYDPDDYIRDRDEYTLATGSV